MHIFHSPPNVTAVTFCRVFFRTACRSCKTVQVLILETCEAVVSCCVFFLSFHNIDTNTSDRNDIFTIVDGAAQVNKIRNGVENSTVLANKNSATGHHVDQYHAPRAKITPQPPKKTTRWHSSGADTRFHYQYKQQGDETEQSTTATTTTGYQTNNSQAELGKKQ